MAKVELTQETLTVHVQGADQLWALKSRLEIPLSHVVGAEADPEVALGWWKGIRAPGTYLPGVIAAGIFYQEGEKVFWDVHDSEKTVVISLKDEKYSRLVVEVEDPDSTVKAIREALGD